MGEKKNWTKTRLNTKGEIFCKAWQFYSFCFTQSFNTYLPCLTGIGSVSLMTMIWIFMKYKNLISYYNESESFDFSWYRKEMGSLPCTSCVIQQPDSHVMAKLIVLFISSGIHVGKCCLDPAKESPMICWVIPLM